MEIPLRPVVRDESSATFFDGTAKGQLLLRRDLRTGTYLDPRTDDDQAHWVATSGFGTVVSWTVVHGKDAEGQPARTALGIVELDEGPWWWCRLTGVDPDADLMGLPVVAEFPASSPESEHEAVPVFRPRVEAGER